MKYEVEYMLKDGRELTGEQYKAALRAGEVNESDCVSMLVPGALLLEAVNKIVAEKSAVTS